MSRAITRAEWEAETRRITKEMLREGLVLRTETTHDGGTYVELWLEGELLTKAELPGPQWEDD